MKGKLLFLGAIAFIALLYIVISTVNSDLFDLSIILVHPSPNATNENRSNFEAVVTNTGGIYDTSSSSIGPASLKFVGDGFNTYGPVAFHSSTRNLSVCFSTKVNDSSGLFFL